MLTDQFGSILLLVPISNVVCFGKFANNGGFLSDVASFGTAGIVTTSSVICRAIESATKIAETKSTVPSLYSTRTVAV